ncbi:MAG: hypothetical protein AVDCRST_MAG65-2381, partial [uncultured Solirubrobacteraceae bacterium]
WKRLTFARSWSVSPVPSRAAATWSRAPPSGPRAPTSTRSRPGSSPGADARRRSSRRRLPRRGCSATASPTPRPSATSARRVTSCRPARWMRRRHPRRQRRPTIPRS